MAKQLARPICLSVCLLAFLYRYPPFGEVPQRHVQPNLPWGSLISQVGLGWGTSHSEIPGPLGFARLSPRWREYCGQPGAPCLAQQWPGEPVCPQACAHLPTWPRPVAPAYLLIDGQAQQPQPADSQVSHWAHTRAAQVLPDSDSGTRGLGHHARHGERFSFRAGVPKVHDHHFLFWVKPIMPKEDWDLLSTYGLPPRHPLQLFWGPTPPAPAAEAAREEQRAALRATPCPLSQTRARHRGPPGPLQTGRQRG